MHNKDGPPAEHLKRADLKPVSQGPRAALPGFWPYVQVARMLENFVVNPGRAIWFSLLYMEAPSPVCCPSILLASFSDKKGACRWLLCSEAATAA